MGINLAGTYALLTFETRAPVPKDALGGTEAVKGAESRASAGTPTFGAKPRRWGFG